MIEVRRRGLIPGPDEQPEDFWKRVAHAIPQPQRLDVREVYGARPDWVEVRHAPEDLHCWEGGATLFEEGDYGCHPTILVRGGTLFCSSADVVAHECVHAMRCQFPFHPFEELLAWRTHPTRLARYLACGCLEPLQLGIQAVAMVTWCCSLVLEQPMVGNGALCLFALPWLRSLFMQLVCMEAERVLERFGWPGSAALLHFTWAEVCSLAFRRKSFLREWRAIHPFRFKFLEGCFAVLRDMPTPPWRRLASSCPTVRGPESPRWMYPPARR